MTGLEDAVRTAARQAGVADAKRGDHYHGAHMLALLARAAHARQQGKTKEQFFAELPPDLRAYLKLDA